MKTISVNIEQVMQRMNNQLQESEIIVKRIRPFFSRENISYENFLKMLSLQGSEYFKRKGENKYYQPQEHHLFVISNMYKWLVGDDTFEVKQGIPGDLYKGIVLAGNIGCGKTSLMSAFLNTLEIIAEDLRIVIKHTKPVELTEIAKQGRLEDYTKGILDVDDICREATSTKVFGNVIKPMVDLIGRRYYTSHLTFGTTNFTPEIINHYYGSFTADRLFSLCNYIRLDGQSLRPVQSNIQLKLDIEN